MQNQTRTTWPSILIGMLLILLYLALPPFTVADEKPAAAKPNVIILLTDDQGFGDFGATGNPLVRTPHMDRFAAQAASLTNFHVMPVRPPTRACLMTGRYNYRTGIFGKWHLGDNYPMRCAWQSAG